MSSKIKIKRGTRQAFDDLAIKGGLSEGEPLLITDENRLAIGLSANSYNTAALQSEVVGRNKFINGKMELAQRGTSFATASASSYSLDMYRWRGGFLDYTTAQDTSAPSGFFNSIKFTANSAAGANTSSIVEQLFEGYNVRDLIGNTFVVSFWVKSSKVGTYSVSFRNAGADRSYVTNYTILKANTWEFKSVVVEGGLITAGTWNWDNGTGLLVGFAFCGVQSSIATSTLNQWVTGAFFYSTGHANALDVIGGNFAMTGLQLEVGRVPTKYEHRHYLTELMLAQRYYFRVGSGAQFYLMGQGQCTSTTVARIITQFPVTMRIAPTALLQSGTATNYAVSNAAGTSVACSAVPTFVSASPNYAQSNFTVASGLVAGDATFGFAASGVSTAFLAWSADLS